MNINTFVHRHAQRLSKERFSHPKRTLRQLIARRLDCSEMSLITHPDTALSANTITGLEGDIRALENGAPLALIYGTTPFLDWEFKVDGRALIPRPETERLGQKVIEKWPHPQEPNHILDLCCGSGVLGLSLGLRFQTAQITLTDLSEEALSLCRENVTAHKLEPRVRLLQGDLWDPLVTESPTHSAKLHNRFDLIVANPPYIGTEENLPASVLENDPHLALFSDEKGTRHIKKILLRLPQYLKAEGFAAFELGHRHKEPISAWLDDHLPQACYSWERDLRAVPRFLFLKIPPKTGPLIEG